MEKYKWKVYTDQIDENIQGNGKYYTLKDCKDKCESNWRCLSYQFQVIIVENHKSNPIQNVCLQVGLKETGEGTCDIFYTSRSVQGGWDIHSGKCVEKEWSEIKI